MVSLTRVSGMFEPLEDDLGFRSLLRFLVPALFGNLPDRWSNSRGFEASWLRWSLLFPENDGNGDIIIVGKWHLPGRKLEGETI